MFPLTLTVSSQWQSPVSSFLVPQTGNSGIHFWSSPQPPPWSGPIISCRTSAVTSSLVSQLSLVPSIVCFPHSGQTEPVRTCARSCPSSTQNPLWLLFHSKQMLESSPWLVSPCTICPITSPALSPKTLPLAPL